MRYVYFCRVCRQRSVQMPTGATKTRNVIAQPCGHEQPMTDQGYRGLGYERAVVRKLRRN